ncbi:hypothetical protein WN55_10001 [Dufourea novaeangliae]|uniref:Uncharacterized protein n=1 Tax=Dufourea novaeangliae TaxID=178035 RepID=A0A154PAB5_DUFNO|nr:hypothetical protein WN55_10001 [Dufourea novaeangliae]
MRHDFTGRWSGECHAIGCPCYVLHVSCMEGGILAAKSGAGKGTETGKSVPVRCDGEHLIRKQMSHPKRALPPHPHSCVLHIYCAKEFTPLRLNRGEFRSDTTFSPPRIVCYTDFCNNYNGVYGVCSKSLQSEITTVAFP